MRNQKIVTSTVCAAVVFFGVVMPASAELSFSRHFGNDMVLQRDKPVTVTGFADKGVSVTVTLADQKKTTIADDDGAWRVTLDPMPTTTKPQTLTARSSKPAHTSQITNLLIGDVILFARQTSVDVSLGRTDVGKKAASSHKKNSLLRHMAIRTIPAKDLQADLASAATDGWAKVSKDSALAISAAAYYLGRDLASEVGVPIGLIDLNLGDAFPISWLSRSALEDTTTLYGKSDVPGQLSLFDKMVKAEETGVLLPKKKVIETNVVAQALFPSGGYNAVLNPLRGITLKAAVLQLGNDYPYMLYAQLEEEGTEFDRVKLNTCYVDTYLIRKVGFRTESVTIPRIPRVWRETLGEKDLPMGLISPPGSDLNTLGQHHREMRELQRRVAADNPHVGIILPGSENTPYSSQPQDEELLAKRCLSWVLGAVYKTADVTATGPVFERLDLNLNEATIHFKEGTAKGLKASGDALDYFEVAAVEGDYVPVKATIEGDTIQIQSDTVNRIVRVRYNWNKRPNQQLVNSASLPVIPFRSEKVAHDWFVVNSDDDLPMEYHTPANEWKKSDVTLVNGQLKTHGYDNFTGWLGPIGIRTGPFGPNMAVREVAAGSPADSNMFVGDVIYSANGAMLGYTGWEVMGAAITESETKKGNGKLVLGVRRAGRNIDVEITLQVMGTYSSTAPYDCLKTEKIITQLEEWLVKNGAGAGFLNTDAIFLLASGNPEIQGYARRAVYAIISKKIPTAPIEPTKAGKSWHNSAEAFLLSEYYLATGDKNVLPHLTHACARLAASQNESGGWRHNFPGGPTYGFIPNAGLPGVIGMGLAAKAGLDINMDSYRLGVKHFGKDRAETGYLIYGSGGCERPIPKPFDPELMAAGKMDSYNGGLSAAGILMEIAENPRAAHMASLMSAFAWNNTFHGHGGNFWNNYWTPLGAHQHGKAAFINFWKNHRWYRESNRMFDGSLIQTQGARVGAGCGMALVAPRKRLQVLGAPASPFSVDAPKALAPAVEAYWKKDYAGCEEMVATLLASDTVGKTDLPTVEALARAAREIQESITADLARMATLIDEDMGAEASSFIASLRGVMAASDERLAKIEKTIGPSKPVAKAKKVKAVVETEKPRDWVRFVTETPTGNSKTKGKTPVVTARPEEASVWKIQVVEDRSQTSEDWADPKFDDSEWKETTLPISWRMYHTAMLRTTFTVEDKSVYDGLRFYAWLFRQQGIEIYLNGELISKVNNLEKKTGDVTNGFKETALKHLKNGENTLAVTTRHNWRWGMLFMRVYNDGFDFNLDARLKSD